MYRYVSDIFGNDVDIEVENLEEFEAMIADIYPEAVGGFERKNYDYYFNGELVLEEI
jgi:hypothetical protein